MPLRPKDKSEGFTLIEFLVALLVFAVGILALTSLQIFVLRSDISAHHQAQAVQIAYSMMDRLRSNRSAAIAGSYNIPNAAAISVGDGNLSMSVSTATIRSGMIDHPVTTFNINLTLENLQTKNNRARSVCCRPCFCIRVSQFGSAVKKAPVVLC